MDDSIFSKDGYRWDWYSVLISEPIDELSNELYEYAVNKSIKSPRGLSRQQLQEKREALKDIAQRMISALYIAYCG